MEETPPSKAPKRERGRPVGSYSVLPLHRKALALVNDGVPLSRALKSLGYSPAVYNNTPILKKTKSWQKLMEEQLPDQLLATRHRELLDKREYREEIVGKGKNRRVELVDAGVDVTAVKAGLEMAYKLKGKVTPAEVPTAPTIQVNNLFYKPEVRASLSAFEENLKHIIAHGPAQEVVEKPDASVAPEIVDAGGGAPDGYGGTVHADNGTGDDAGPDSAATRDAEDEQHPA
jgi:hypothetical protein